MTIKELLKIAKNDRLMFMLNVLHESIENDCCRTVLELESEKKARKIMAKKIIEDLERMN